jgi:uncharacterized protein YcsI (UPF0317 family)
VTNDEYARMSGGEIRSLCRQGRFQRPTTGVALGFAQVNLVVLPASHAGDFEHFCRLNPKPCPLLEMTKAGTFEPAESAPGADLRTDLPRYRVYRHGICVDRPTSVAPYWQDDFVAFLIGCSFTFESALIEAGVSVRHIEESRNVPMYRTTLACAAAGPFAGPLVVSMRPMTPRQAELAAKVTASLPRVHGEPVHTGNPAAIGIADLGKPDYGEAVTIRSNEIPVFWACGVTPMEAIMRAKPDVAITHDPGHMLVTDILDQSLVESDRGS